MSYHSPLTYSPLTTHHSTTHHSLFTFLFRLRRLADGAGGHASDKNGHDQSCGRSDHPIPELLFAGQGLLTRIPNQDEGDRAGHHPDPGSQYIAPETDAG